MKYFLFNVLLHLIRKKIIIILPNYIGLGNRIKQLASYDICFGLNNTILIWSCTGWVTKGFSELFQLEGVNGFKNFNVPYSRYWPVVISFPTKKEFRERGYWRLYVKEKEVPIFFNITRGGKSFPAIDFKFLAIPDEIKKKYILFFKKLKPSKIVQDRINQICITKNEVCVQVRNSRDKNDTANVSEINEYIRIMNDYPLETKFFISAMDRSFSDEFYKVFGNRVFELPEKNYKSMIDATADLYLLGMGKDLILCQGSTFAEVSWWLGGCSQRVISVPISYRQ